VPGARRGEGDSLALHPTAHIGGIDPIRIVVTLPGLDGVPAMRVLAVLHQTAGADAAAR